MNDLDQLEKEQTLGRKAQQAYDSWLRNYLDTQSVLYFEEFKTSQDLMEIRYKMNALMTIEVAVKKDIETGKLASKQLNGE